MTQNSRLLAKCSKDVLTINDPKLALRFTVVLEELKAEGLELLPHQKEAIVWSLNRQYGYLALDAGLGKTIVAAVITRILEAHAIYICPPFLASNVYNEFSKWGVPPEHTHVVRDTTDCEFAGLPENIVLFIDEAHRFKTEKSNRTLRVLAHLKAFKDKRIYAMSGTPMPNSRPMELWPFLKTIGSSVFGTNKFFFGRKYCGAKHNGFGWSFDGFTCVQEFKHRIFANFMLRQKKALLNLPPKIEGITVIGLLSDTKANLDYEKILVDQMQDTDLLEGMLKLEAGKDLHLMEYLKMLGVHKADKAVEYISDLLENPNEAILIFAKHKDVIKKLHEGLAAYNPLIITGQTPTNERLELVNEFQNNKDRRVFIGNIQACGVGFTLTKAKRVIFVEYSFVDGENTQASDRAHRIGQTGTVSVQYLALENSFDKKLLEILLNKRKRAI